MTTPDQQTLACARTVTVHGYAIRFPLAGATTRCRRIATTQARGERTVARPFAAIQRDISDALSLGEGAICPLTGKLIRIYRRALNRGQVATLQRLRRFHDRHPGEAWAHVSDFSGRRDGDLGKLLWWDLIERRPTADCPPERPRGWWRITALACDWLSGTITIPRQQALLLGHHLGPVDDDDRVTVAQVLREAGSAALIASGDECDLLPQTLPDLVGVGT
jgi:hypothetical protein